MGVDEIEESGGGGRELVEMRRVREVVTVDKQEEVLFVPPLDLGVVPNAGTEDVENLKVVTAEKSGPVVWPLFIEVVGAALERDGGGEEDDGAGASERLDEGGGGGGFKVFGDFKGDGEVVSLGSSEGLVEVMAFEVSGRDLEDTGGEDIVAVETEDIGGAVLLKLMQPGAGAAAEFNDGFGVDEFGDERDDVASGILRAGALPFEVVSSVSVVFYPVRHMGNIPWGLTGGEIVGILG